MWKWPGVPFNGATPPHSCTVKSTTVGNFPPESLGHLVCLAEGTMDCPRHTSTVLFLVWLAGRLEARSRQEAIAARTREQATHFVTQTATMGPRTRLLIMQMMADDFEQENRAHDGRGKQRQATNRVSAAESTSSSLLQNALDTENAALLSRIRAWNSAGVVRDNNDVGLVYLAAASKWSKFEALLTHGADVDGRDEDGNTALHLVAMSERVCLRLGLLLVWSGADPTIMNHHGETPADVSRSDDFKMALQAWQNSASGEGA